MPPQPDPSDAGAGAVTAVLLLLDVAGSVRLMEADESGFILQWRRFVRTAREDILPLHGGRIRKSLGDGLLIEFQGASEALLAAQALHRAAEACSPAGRPDRGIRLRMAAHLARFVSDELDIYGSGVNLAARLAQSAAPGELRVSATLRNLLPASLGALLHDLGPCALRHVSQPAHVFRMELGPAPRPRVAAAAVAAAGWDSGFW